MTKCTFIMITARSDFPYLGRPNLHVFEPTLYCFKQQTMMDFEWIIVDMLYDQRKDYFKNMKLPFKVKHVPALPNIWLENNFSGMCTQYNRGIIYADGELLFFAGDSHMMQPNFMEKLWSRYQEGYFPLAWYFFDGTFIKSKEQKESQCGRFDGTTKKQFDIAYPEQDVDAPFSYNILGYTGKNASIEHRYIEAFKNQNRKICFASWGWWFGCSSASMEAMLKINGFNQKFDGDRMLFDCDVGSRLEMAGYGARLALFNDFYLIRAATKVGIWNPKLTKDSISIKCNYPLIFINRNFNRYKANVHKLNEIDIKWIKEMYCKDLCGIREDCKRKHPWQYPFEHKEGYQGHKSSKKWFNFWKEHQGLIDLEEERKLRKSGEKYQEGTFI